MHEESEQMNPTFTTSPKEGNRCGVIGLVFSIIGLALCGLWLLTIPGFILSLIGLRKEPRKAATAGAIIGGVGFFVFPLLVAIMLPALATARTVAKRAITSDHMVNVQHGSDAYYADHQRYPTSFDELESGSYIKHDQTMDSWGKTMQFEGGGDAKPVITSAGEDGEFGTQDDVTEKE